MSYRALDMAHWGARCQGYQRSPRARTVWPCGCGAATDEVEPELELGDEVDSFVVDVRAYPSVKAAVTQTKVAINTIEPYWKNVDPVVPLCNKLPDTVSDIRLRFYSV
jgi:hypothetical protein